MARPMNLNECKIIFNRVVTDATLKVQLVTGGPLYIVTEIETTDEPHEGQLTTTMILRVAPESP